MLARILQFSIIKLKIEESETELSYPEMLKVKTDDRGKSCKTYQFSGWIIYAGEKWPLPP